MASSLLAVSLLTPPLSFSSKTHLPLLLRPPLLSTTIRIQGPRRTISSSFLLHAKNDESPADPPDRILSAACYLYPFLDGVQYGRYILTQFPVFQLVLQPLFPAIRLFRSSPLNPFLLFLTLYFAVVRNPSRFSRYVRFNTMQAIVLDVLLIFPDLIERTFNPKGGIGLDALQSLDSTVFLFLLVSLMYGSTSCILGQVPRLPIVADAADRQVISIYEVIYQALEAIKKQLKEYEEEELSI
ncbi:protein TIC 20-v, chloroplastic isoform X2 [Typha angustifolia]|uniref:protein TIC 20-v, chloroplastic isoform X2 n=1 Tax=Typha angustifolia TaxID=59011 RepID=UPI003C2F1FE6